MYKNKNIVLPYLKSYDNSFIFNCVDEKNLQIMQKSVLRPPKYCDIPFKHLKTMKVMLLAKQFPEKQTFYIFLQIIIYTISLAY